MPWTAVLCCFFRPRFDTKALTSGPFITVITTHWTHVNDRDHTSVILLAFGQMKNTYIAVMKKGAKAFFTAFGYHGAPAGKAIIVMKKEASFILTKQNWSCHPTLRQLSAIFSSPYCNNTETPPLTHKPFLLLFVDVMKMIKRMHVIISLLLTPHPRKRTKKRMTFWNENCIMVLLHQ